jgi:hypothetical protein
MMTTAIGVLGSFVTEEGEVIPLAELPYPRRELFSGYLFTGVSVVPVPGTNRVWVTVAWRRDTLFGPGGEGETDLALYEVSTDGWRRLASSREEFEIYFGWAFRNGDLLGRGRTALTQDRFYARARLAVDGTIELLKRWGSEDVALDSLLWSAYPLASGNAGVVAIRYPPEAPASQENWFLHLTPDLELAQPAERLGAAYDDPTYEMDPDHGPSNPWVFDAHLRPDGSAVLLFTGALAGRGAAFRSQFWLQRITADGDLVFPIPGVPVNPTDYLRQDQVSDTGFLAYTNAEPFGPGLVGVIWDERTLGKEGGSVRVQVVDDAGERRFPEALDLGPSHEIIIPEWAIDGEGRAYQARAEFRYETGMERMFSIARYGPDVELLWPRVYVQSCERRVAVPGMMVVGAQTNGAYLMWDDTEPDINGVPTTIAKIALVRSDGTFAWGP